jgi:hypothetical protein
VYVTPDGTVGAPTPWPLDLWRSGESGDAFALAFGWHNRCDHDYRTQMLRLGIVDVIFSPVLNNTYQNTPLNCWDCDPFFMYGTNDQRYLTNDLADFGVGNFFWYGHAQQIGFGATKDADNEPDVSFVSILDLQAALGNTWDLHRKHLIKAHPYRLVILEGCETAEDSQLAEAFGILGGIHSKSWFEKHGESPQAYVGWAGEIFIPNCPMYTDLFTSHSAHQADMFGLWMSEVPLVQCVAAGATPYLNLLGAPVPFDTPLDPNWVIFGDPYLTRTPANEP